jgi:predicted RNase H-like HicB family nuclease
MRYRVVIEKGDLSYGAFVPDLPGCIAVGESESEVIYLIEEAIQFHLEDLKIAGDFIPQAVSKSVFVDVPLMA